MEGPSDPLERLMQAFECSLCSHTFRDAVCFPTTCGHYFCRECVIATLEGPGISKSECPVCHKPSWKNDLKVSYTVNNALVHAAGLRAEVQRGREAEARLRERSGSGAQPTAAGAAGSLARPGSAGPALVAAARPPSHGGAGGSAGKRKRRGRSVPEQQEHQAATLPPADQQQQQAAHLPPADQQQQQQQPQQGEGWRERQPQRLWGRKKAAPSSAAAQAQQQQQQPLAFPPDAPPAAAAAAGRAAEADDMAAATAAAALNQSAAGQCAAPQSAATAGVKGHDVEAPESPVPVLYDSDWEEQARAAPLGPVTPEAIAVLEAEVALLQQAIQLCDELPCLTGSRRQGQQQQQAQQPAAEQQAEEAAQGAALQGGPASTATGVQQQQAAGQNGQDEVIVPDTEECGLLPSPPKSASTAAAASSEPVAAGCGAGPQQAQQQHSEQQQQQDEQQEQQSVRSQERKRRLGELRAAQEQERALQAGLTQEMEDEEGHRMSGRKRRKGGLARAAPGSSRLGRPADSAAANANTDAAGPVQEHPAVQQAQQAAQQAAERPQQQAAQQAAERPQQQAAQQAAERPQQQAAQQAARLSKAAVGEGDAVEVMWQADGQLVPYVGVVVEVLPEGKHRIEYLDGERATQDLDEEQWRLLLQEEYEAAEAEYLLQEQASSSSGGTCSSGEEFQVSSGSEGGHSASQPSGEVKAVTSPAVVSSVTSGADDEAAGAAGAAAVPVAAVPSPAAPAMSTGPSTAPASAPQLQRQAAAGDAVSRAQPAPASAAADPYAFVSNTEAAADEAQLFQAAPQRTQHAARPQAQQQVQQAPRQRAQVNQQAKPATARKRPLVPPPKFNQEPTKRPQQQLVEGSEQQMPEWLQQPAAPGGKPEQQQWRQQAAEAAAAQQQFGRKRKEAGDGAATKTIAPQSAAHPQQQQPQQPQPQQPQPQQPPPQQQQLARRPRLHERPSMQQRRRRRAESEEEQEAAQQQAAVAAAVAGAAGEAEVPPAAADGAGVEAVDVVPSTQDAAGALFSMLQEKPAAAGAEGSGGVMASLPLQPTSTHNAAAGDGGFVPASQLPLAGDWETEAAAEQPQQRRQQQPAAAGPRRASGKVLQDPGLFGLPPAGRGSGRRKSALQDPGLFSQSSEGSGSHAWEAAAAGAAAAGAAAVAPAAHEASGPQAASFTDLFAGATPSQAAWPSSPEPEGEPEGSEAQAAAAAEAAAAEEASSPGGSTHRCITVSGLNNEIQQKLLTLRELLGGVALENQVSQRTTHVLVPMDDRGCVKQRSVQYLLALAHGCWVLGHGWVDACLEARQWLPERQYEAKGMLEMKDSTFVAAAARQRHAPGGGPGLFVGRRVFLTVAPATSGGGRSSSTGSAGKVALVAQMVAAEGGTLVRALGQGEGGGGRGAASPSPSPEGATLLVCVAQGVNEARMGLRMGQKRYPGRPMYHQSWIFDSLCCGRCLDPADYVMTEQRPLPTGARLSLSQQPSQAAAGDSQA